MTWTKLARTGSGKGPRSRPAVARQRSGSKSAKMILPPNLHRSSAADYYHDPKRNMIALRQHSGGEFPLYESGSCWHVSLPREFHELIPYGTSDVELRIDGDMLVLDLNAIGEAG